MKAILLCSLLCVALASVRSQSITISPLTKTTYCIGDTLSISYQASGTFEYNNSFFAQLSDANGSFKTFNSMGRSISGSGTIKFTLNNNGQHYRVRVASGAPYVYSADNGVDIQVLNAPSPYPTLADNTHTEWIDYPSQYLDAAGFINDTIHLIEHYAQPSGTTFHWMFNEDAIALDTTSSKAAVLYPTPGLKTGVLEITNPAGCKGTHNFRYLVLTCQPVIPANATIITGSVTGDDSIVWVRAGGSYSIYDSQRGHIIFVEPGGSINLAHAQYSLSYLLTGSSITTDNGGIIVQASSTVTGDRNAFNCRDLIFDYSQVSGEVRRESQASQISIRQTSEHLFARAEGEPMGLRLINLLGNEVLSQRGTGELDVDLLSLPNGFFFAVVQAGEEHVVKQISVVH
jgi:hypothetical protein